MCSIKCIIDNACGPNDFTLCAQLCADFQSMDNCTLTSKDLNAVFMENNVIIRPQILNEP